MKFLSSSSKFLVHGFLIAPVLCDSFNLSAWESTTGGSVITHRIWYGDGLAYTGAGIPSSVKEAFNITSLGNRADLIYVSVDETTSAPGTPPLPDPTFLVINTAPGASDPLFFTHSAVNLSDTDVYIWIGYEGFLLAMARGNLLQSGSGGFYIVPSDLEGTYTVRYITEGATAEKLGARKVMLTSRQLR